MTAAEETYARATQDAARLVATAHRYGLGEIAGVRCREMRGQFYVCGPDRRVRPCADAIEAIRVAAELFGGGR